MELVLICAIGRNREIGRGGDLVWRISDDLKRFKKMTMGHPIIMGRKTHESVGRSLPGRTNIVVTRQAGYKSDGCRIVGSVDEALEEAAGSDGGELAFVVGGGQLYTALIDKANRLALTVVDAEDPDADTWFPAFEDMFETSSEEGPFAVGGVAYRFVDYSRITEGAGSSQ